MSQDTNQADIQPAKVNPLNPRFNRELTSDTSSVIKIDKKNGINTAAVLAGNLRITHSRLFKMPLYLSSLRMRTCLAATIVQVANDGEA